jgi:hypothetical protein
VKSTKSASGPRTSCSSFRAVYSPSSHHVTRLETIGLSDEAGSTVVQPGLEVLVVHQAVKGNDSRARGQEDGVQLRPHLQLGHDVAQMRPDGMDRDAEQAGGFFRTQAVRKGLKHGDFPWCEDGLGLSGIGDPSWPAQKLDKGLRIEEYLPGVSPLDRVGNIVGMAFLREVARGTGLHPRQEAVRVRLHGEHDGLEPGEVRAKLHGEWAIAQIQQGIAHEGYARSGAPDSREVRRWISLDPDDSDLGVEVQGDSERLGHELILFEDVDGNGRAVWIDGAVLDGVRLRFMRGPL